LAEQESTVLTGRLFLKFIAVIKCSGMVNSSHSNCFVKVVVGLVEVEDILKLRIKLHSFLALT